MVLVPSHHAGRAVEDDVLPFGAVIRDGVLVRAHRAELLPGAVGLEVGLVHHIQAVLVAQVVEARVVGVMAGAHGVDVVPLHVHHIPQHLFHRHAASAPAAPLVAVDALDDDPLAVHQHQAVLHLDAAQAGAAGDLLGAGAGFIVDAQGVGVEVGMLGAPQHRVLHLGAQLGRAVLTHRLHRFAEHLGLDAGGRFGLHAAGELQRAALPVVGQRAGDGEVLEMHRGGGEQVHAAEQAGETPEVLVFQPAAAAEAEHLHRQAVLSGMHQGGQVGVRAHQIYEDAVGVHQRGVVKIDAEGEVVIRTDHVKGRALDLLPRWRGGIKVDKICLQPLLAQLRLVAENIHGRAHRAAGDMPIIDRQDGVTWDAHVVDQCLTGGAKGLRNAPCGTVQEFKCLVAVHFDVLPLSGVNHLTLLVAAAAILPRRSGRLPPDSPQNGLSCPLWTDRADARAKRRKHKLL